MSRVAVLGAGSWGTTLAVHLAQAEHEVRLWDIDSAHLDQIEGCRENRKFLAGIALPEGIKVQPKLEVALDGAEFTLFVVPSHGMRGCAERVAATGLSSQWVCAAKGLELGTLKRMTEVLAETLPGVEAVLLVGPSHAEEVSRGLPTSIVAAAASETQARRVQELCASPRLRVYTNRDVAGCEYGAGLKNVIAIAAGICDGLGYGDNTKGALLTRGLAEITRLGVALGGRRETFYGLTGMGDLITTAISRHSRNRLVGERLGRGETVEQVLAGMVMVAEGVNTAQAAYQLALQRGVETPITEQVRSILLERKDPRAALEALMARELKSEEWKGDTGRVAAQD
ncbi:MAG: NAD(P)-dependent glycerol-3-phosphate dehydrogenase [Candidatus Eisenbacteria bacterium]|uniref:Glycerol-3-phosphate dehydrogenase [NAD(P)+] n=1 Tax=Eiseniibacteriota bacterium TaxID=2212470 RepID=A0A538UCH4_UNCEI|nr:MAG: NAD(P)-dependent glycerol-3-phosphate dehydrogenase [Candidatus Eisenbacteria bacterium]